MLASHATPYAQRGPSGRIDLFVCGRSVGWPAIHNPFNGKRPQARHA
jgi:hypothetical protein